MGEKDVGEQDVTATMTAVATAVGAPESILPWLGGFYDDADADLVLAAASRTGDGGQAAGHHRSGRAGDGAAALAGFDEARLERAVRRAVLDVDEAGAYAPASFHDRLEIWAMLEGWKGVPRAVRQELVAWDVDYYAERIRPGVEAVRDGRGGDQGLYTYVLLREAEAIVSAQEHVYLWPCDCRSIVGTCRKPMDVCLRFTNDRGLGWEISRERAVDILRATDKAGLMHTADFAGDPAAAGAICNCCADCCYPHLATERLGTGDVWPVRRHVARIDMDACKACGRCGLRCPFSAIVCRTDGLPILDPSLCRGCGLCATGCSSDAIDQQLLAAR